MTLSTKQRDALSAYVSNLLTECVNDTRDPSVVDAFVNDIASITRNAMCDVMETWNRTACGVMCRLPLELLAQSFSWLNFRERARLTAVSRYFRSVALAHPSLWTRIEMDDRTPRLYDTLALLLERSGRATLDVHIYAPDDSETVSALLIPHVPRIRTLDLDAFTWSCINGHPAPVLEVLQVLAVAHLHTVLPSPAWVPFLHRLQLRSTFVLPRYSGQLDNVTYFSGWMTTGDGREVLNTDACTLFDVFPSLEILHLSFRRIAPVNKFPNTRAPRTLRELTLYDEGDRTNITSLLALWHGHPFRAVYLHSHHGDLVTPALEHLRSISSGPWHIDIGETECVLRTEHDAVYEVYLNGKLPDIRRYLGSLRSIAAPAYIFPSRLTQMSNMPSLHSVTLRGFFPASDWELYEGELCVPGLQTLRVEPLREDEEQDQVAELDRCSQYMWALVQRLTLEDGSELPRIPRLVFSKVARPYVREEYLAWIYQRASSVYIEDELLWQEETDN